MNSKKESNSHVAETIYINGRYLTQPNTGVQRYAHEIIKSFDNLLEVSKIADTLRVHCLVPQGTSCNTSWKNIRIEPIGINHGNLWEQFDLPFYLKGNFLFSPANTGPILYSNQAITFHDASIFAVPHSYSFLFRTKYQIIFKSLSRIARVIFTDSKFSQVELSQHLKYPLERFKVVHLAGDHINQIQPDMRILEKHNLSKNGYLLTVSSHSPHKNLEAVRRALELLNRDIKIVFAGGRFPNVFNKTMISTERDKGVLLGYITDKELKALYLNALGYIFPSYYEGFGLPILEAMHCGCPVLCARAASLPEIAGEAALFFEPMNINDIAASIDKIIANESLRHELIQKGYHRAQEFSWQTTAHATLRTLLIAAGTHL